MVDNPAEMFDLQRFGKTYGYIKAPVSVIQQSPDKLYDYLTHYTMKQKDVEILSCLMSVDSITKIKPEMVGYGYENAVLDEALKKLKNNY